VSSLLVVRSGWVYGALRDRCRVADRSILLCCCWRAGWVADLEGPFHSLRRERRFYIGGLSLFGGSPFGGVLWLVVGIIRVGGSSS
jgi:hypothetical protein